MAAVPELRADEPAPATRPREPAGAFVIGSDYRALGVVRSLGRHGVPVCVLVTPHDRLAAYSRYATSRRRWPREEHAKLELLDRLAASSRKRWALIPSADETAAFVARHHERLADGFVLTTPPWKVFKWAYDKRATHELATRAGVDYPATFYPRDAADLHSDAIRFPAILKPRSKPFANRFTDAKAWRVEDRASLVRRYAEAVSLVDPELLMVQELILGDGGDQFSYAALVDSGRVLHSLVARRTRQYPPDFGRASTFVETIDDDEIERVSERLLAACAYSGLIEVEFKRDRSTGRMLLLDMNPRVWGWHTLGAAAGVDFSWLLFRHAAGEDVPRRRARAGVRWVRLSTDLSVAARDIMRLRLPPRAYLRSLRPPTERAIFASDDPLPGVLEPPTLVVHLGLRLVRHVRG